MTDQTTARWAMPLLAPGQAGKELTHNEALALLDMLVQPAVEAVGTDVPPTAPVAGRCWIVGSAPTGAWAGHAGALAGWTDGGWRFVAPVEGLAAWCISSAKPVAYRNGVWQEGDVVAARVVVAGRQVVGPQAGAIATPAGGDVVDAQVRTAVAEILAALRQHGLIAA
ncbi:DUF2793 domain-containing protein [Sphingomonas sp. RP10(2022)]|uniref:DUF2793 domain-containing protein n=1 Tax=Sphingomonas liriopis TaxID=2949094 RepID=A0A9X2HYD0_9SPHN|nr:DUF2793 domain-containing protein [Sphingomonas liriopis]MCP3735050.1 DUF2793 domain-containing protein [Sphingomonas liriopis]